MSHCDACGGNWRAELAEAEIASESHERHMRWKDEEIAELESKLSKLRQAAIRTMPFSDERHPLPWAGSDVVAKR